MKLRAPQKGTLRFLFIAIVLMLLADQFVFGGKRSYIEEARSVREAAQTQRPAPVRVTPPDGQAYFEEIPAPAPPATVPEPEPPLPAPKATPAPSVPPEPVKESVAPRGSRARIAVIIDDVGMDVRHSREVIALPAPVTLAFLPYAPKTRELAAKARSEGHSLIIHVPMEAMDAGANIGPGGLKTGMDGAAFANALSAMFESFEGYEGINNHMGSRLTQDSAAMARVMAALRDRKLFFVDSKTTEKSVGVREAAKAGIPYAARDVFLDHEDTAAFVHAALARTEKAALKNGQAIAIGHPKENTIAALRLWIPGLKAKGIDLVPVKALVRQEGAIADDSVSDAAPPDLFPEGEAPAYRIPSVKEEEPMAAPEIRLHPLPEEWPSP